MSTWLALDPGGSTGWASYNDWTNKFTCGQLTQQPHHHDLYFLLMSLVRPSELIVEQFDNDGNKAAKLISLEYIGVARLYSQQLNNVSFKLQGRAVAKKLITDKWLKAIGVWDTANKPHGMDAMRHLIRHLVVIERMQQFIPEYTKE